MELRWNGKIEPNIWQFTPYLQCPPIGDQILLNEIMCLKCTVSGPGRHECQLHGKPNENQRAQRHHENLNLPFSALKI